MHYSSDSSGFVSLQDVIPEALPEIRYAGSFNFVGERIDGYEEPVALMTREAAEALSRVNGEAAARGLGLKIFDAYRPRRAVEHFMRWAADPEDQRMKEAFYPDIPKAEIIPRGYVAPESSHSRGSTVDLTLVDLQTREELDMGGSFDFFGERSHPDYAGLTEAQRANRRLLREMMTRQGFLPIETEWWHFTLANEPYPETCFTFPVRQDQRGRTAR